MPRCWQPRHSRPWFVARHTLPLRLQLLQRMGHGMRQTTAGEAQHSLGSRLGKVDLRTQFLTSHPASALSSSSIALSSKPVGCGLVASPRAPVLLAAASAVDTGAANRGMASCIAVVSRFVDGVGDAITVLVSSSPKLDAGGSRSPCTTPHPGLVLQSADCGGSSRVLSTSAKTLSTNRTNVTFTEHRHRCK